MKHINLVVPKGQTIALVGQSGSGKSTLVDLLPRYHDIHFGEIMIDGVSTKNFRIHDLRRTLGSYEAITGTSLHIIGKSLGHKSSQSTEVYARLSLDPIRNAAQRACNQMTILANKQGDKKDA